MPSSVCCSPERSFGCSTPSGRSSSSRKVQGSTRCSSVVGGRTKKSSRDDVPPRLAATVSIASPKAYGAPTAVLSTWGMPRACFRYWRSWAASDLASAFCCFLVRPAFHAVSTRRASPSKTARKPPVAAGSSRLSRISRRVLQVEVLVLEGVGQLVHERGLHDRRQLGAADPDPLVVLRVVADDPGLAELVEALQQVVLALEQPDRPQHRRVVGQVGPVLVGQLVLVGDDLALELLVLEEVHVDRVLELQAALLLDDRDVRLDPRIPGAGVRVLAGLAAQERDSEVGHQAEDHEQHETQDRPEDRSRLRVFGGLVNGGEQLRSPPVGVAHGSRVGGLDQPARQNPYSTDQLQRRA